MMSELNASRGRPVAFVLAASVLALMAGGCAFFAPATIPLGTSLDEVRHSARQPTGEYLLAGGGRRLEFGTGSFGRQTWMLDFDAAGRLVASRQVLTEAQLATIGPGLPRDELLMRFGHPAHVDQIGRQRLQVWNYRYADSDCTWFRVSVSDDGPVIDSALSIDPVCDVLTAPR